MLYLDFEIRRFFLRLIRTLSSKNLLTDASAKKELNIFYESGDLYIYPHLLAARQIKDKP